MAARLPFFISNRYFPARSLKRAGIRESSPCVGRTTRNENFLTRIFLCVLRVSA